MSLCANSTYGTGRILYWFKPADHSVESREWWWEVGLLLWHCVSAKCDIVNVLSCVVYVSCVASIWSTNISATYIEICIWNPFWHVLFCILLLILSAVVVTFSTSLVKTTHTSSWLNRPISMSSLLVNTYNSSVDSLTLLSVNFFCSNEKKNIMKIFMMFFFLFEQQKFTESNVRVHR